MNFTFRKIGKLIRLISMFKTTLNNIQKILMTFSTNIDLIKYVGIIASPICF